MVIIIAALDANNGIGYKGNLLFKIPEDMKFFKEITTKNKYVIMGRKTFESIGMPLSNRHSYVVTRSSAGKPFYENVEYISGNNIENLLQSITSANLNICVIGGAEIYKQLMPYCDEMYLTKIPVVSAFVDAYFPDINEDEWNQEIIKENEFEGVPYKLWHYSRKS